MKPRRRLRSSILLGAVLFSPAILRPTDIIDAGSEPWEYPLALEYRFYLMAGPQTANLNWQARF